MVVEEDPQRRERWCALLSRHGLAALPVRPDELARVESEGPLLVVVSDGHADSDGWEIAEQVRVLNPGVPIILLGKRKTDGASRPDTVQACLPREVADERFLKEIDRWIRIRRPEGPRHLEPILVVDDEPKFLTILKHFLELRGFRVIAARSGEEAIEQLALTSPAAMLLDIRMPGMDGLLTLKHIRITHPNLPVIFITNMDEDEKKREAVLLGANNYLVKPFDFDQLETVLLTNIFT